MEEQRAIVCKSYLGVEDHGLLVATLTLDYGTSKQTYLSPTLANAVRGWARCGEYLRRLLAVCDADSWEGITGKPVVALLSNESYNAKIVGLQKYIGSLRLLDSEWIV